VVGAILGSTWGIWFPINKKLWTSSYVLFTAGLALVCLAACYWAIDIRRWRGGSVNGGWATRGWAKPFLIFGRNAIAAYIAAWLFAVLPYFITFQVNGKQRHVAEYVFQRFFAPLGSPSFASLLFSLAFVLLCLLPIWLMDRKRIFLKI
jgi:predicted acyltransferase